jgi:peptidoglycan/xylan/chitin deacetylase (PgdA/CDA1 family)
LPARLEILINDKKYSWDLDSTATVSAIAPWNVLSETVPSQPQRVYLDLMKVLHDLYADAREAALSGLAAWAGIDRNHGRQDHLSVKAEELAALPVNGLIEVGAHTVNHSSLSALPLEAQQQEITESKLALERILDRPVSSFSYPFGERRDYSRDTVKLVKEAGFSCACSNFHGHVTALTDPYQLPRFIVRDWDGDTFARKMEEWFRG